jgi:uncharacterized phage protein (TIGR01671 family)
MRDIKFRAWAGERMINRTLFDRNWYSKDDKCVMGATPRDARTLKVMQFTGLKDKNGVEIYEGDLVNIFYTDKCDGFIFDGIYRVDINPSGVKFEFVKLLWELDCYNQRPYEKAEVSEYGFVRGDYKNTSGGFRLCVSESNKWNYSNYFEVIGNIYENPELLK